MPKSDRETRVLTPFLIRIHVQFNNPIRQAADNCTWSAYYKVLGVTATTDSEAKSIVERQINDGTIDWSLSELQIAKVQELSANIRKYAADWSQLGVWFASGRILIPDQPA